MKVIADLVDKIDDEIEYGKEYAEMYLDLKAKKENEWASRFQTMAEQELNHATILHEYATKEINRLSEVYTPPVAMQEAWDKAHAKYIERVSWIKQMLAM